MGTMVKHKGMVSVENGPIWSGYVPIPLAAWHQEHGYFSWCWNTGHEEVNLWAMSKEGNLVLIQQASKAEFLTWVESMGSDELSAFLAEWQ